MWYDITTCKKLICVWFIIFGMSLASAEPYPHTDPCNQGGWVLYEPMSDEFDGTSVDTTKWKKDRPYPVWDGMAPATNKDPDAATVSGGELLLHGFQNPSYSYPTNYDVSAGYITSKDHRRYGYFEMKAKAINADLVSGYWLYSDAITWAREITILEVAAGSPNGRFPQDYYHAGGHIWRTPTPTGVDHTHIEQIQSYTLDFYPIDGYHIYAFEWNKDTMKWYIDGQLIHQMPTGDYTMGEMIFCSTAYHSWQLPNGIDYSRFPATYNVEYLRTWIKPPTNNTYYVDGATGNDSDSGLSWAQAKKSIRAAIDEAYDGDSIWVAQGTYQEYIVLYGIHDMKIYGGFAYGATSLSQQDPALYTTTIQAPPDGLLAVNIQAAGGGVAIMPSYVGTDPVVFEDCEISLNSVGSGGWGYGAGIYIADSGGGSHAGQSHSEFHRCLIKDNSASQLGGAIGAVDGRAAATTVKLVNCIITDNTCSSSEGAIHFNSGSLEMVNCTVNGNTGNGIEIGSHSTMTAVTVKNTIISNNSGTGFWTNWSGIFSGGLLKNNLFYNNTNYNLYDPWGYADTAPQINSRPYASGNIVADPLYVNPSSGDYHLQASSPCIEAGDPDFVPNSNPIDFDGRDRYVDGDCSGTEIVDMGAYEFSQSSLGDFAGGCWVDFIDLSVLGLTWLLEEGQAGYNPICDIGLPADGYIDERDLEMFCNSWLDGVQ